METSRPTITNWLSELILSFILAQFRLFFSGETAESLLT
jgi:hypothetical protein